MSQQNFSGFSRNCSMDHLNLASPEIVVKRNNHRCKTVIGVYLRYINATRFIRERLGAQTDLSKNVNVM